MISKSAELGFKIAGIKQQIIQLEYQNAVLTQKDKQKLQQLKKTLQHLHHNYNVDSEN